MFRNTIAALIAVAAVAAPATAQHPTFSLDTLRVGVGSRTMADLASTTRTVDVVTVERIAQLPVRTLNEVLAYTLGVDLQSRSPAQADLSLRGSSFEQVLVLVDGVRMSDAQTAHFDLDLAIPLSEIERIEVLRGPATALYGSDAVGGVVNIVTRRGDDLRVSLDGGSFGTFGIGAAAGVTGRDHALRVSAEARRSDGHREGTDYETIQARLAADTRLAGRTLRADVGLAVRDFAARAFYTPANAPYDEYEETRTATASLAWLAPAGAKFGLEPRLSFRRHDDEYLLDRNDPSLYRNVHTTWRYGGELIARYAATPSVRLAFGGEAYREKLESNSLGEREEDRAALFAEAVAGDAARATLSAGLRADWYSAFGTFVAPSLAGSYGLTDALRLRASVGRSFRAPSWTDRYYVSPANVGSPDLDPERAWEAELGADFAPTTDVRVSVTGFVRDAEALIDWAQPAGEPEAVWRTRNVAEARFHGIEVEAVGARLLGARWTIGATALRFDAANDDAYTSRYVLRPLTRTALIGVERDLLGGLDAAARLSYGRRAGEDVPSVVNGACVAGAEHDFLRADARLGYRWRNARLTLDATNLADARHCDVSGLFAPGRAFSIGVTWGIGR